MIPVSPGGAEGRIPWLLAAAALLLFVLYIFYRYGMTDERAVSFPVYGNRSMPIEQWGDSAALTGQPQSF